MFTKDPQAKKDYTNDWSARLATGETITASSWTVETGLTQMASPAPSFTDTTTTIWLEGGTAGVHYVVTNHVTTDQGREDDWSFTVQVYNV